MPDWNQQEIIGTKPYPLAFSLYEKQLQTKYGALQLEVNLDINH
ncbi:MAG: hypothetical protein CM15mP129_05680 [Chloroflexota bacterium]|nr:MAG: hypothetical protein CM15mP129_05680 [Chloroflexota bacterium]